MPEDMAGPTPEDREVTRLIGLFTYTYPDRANSFDAETIRQVAIKVHRQMQLRASIPEPFRRAFEE